MTLPFSYILWMLIAPACLTKKRRCTDSHCQDLVLLNGEEGYLGILEAFLVKAQEIKCLRDETKTLKMFLRFRQNSESTYLYLTYFPKFKLELSLLSSSYYFFQNIHIKVDEREHQCKAMGVMWFSSVKEVSHLLSFLHTSASLPHTLYQSWFSLCTPNWSSYSVRAIF